MAAAALGACGLKLNINGQTRTLGGGGAPATTATTAAATPAAATSRSRSRSTAAATADHDEPTAPAAYTAGTITVKDALSSTPLVADIDGVALDGQFRKVLHADSPECGQTVSSHPIAVVDVQQADAGMEIAVAGARNDGFVLRRGDLFWATCTQTTGQVPTMSAPKGGWQTGRYEVFPVTRYAKPTDGFHFEVAVSNPAHLAPWSGDVRAVKIDSKLATPMLIDVPLRAKRAVRREGIAGSSCGKVALGVEPDISLKIARPIPGLVIRPLPSRSPITLRVEQRKDDKRTKYFCQNGRGTGGERGPTWQPESELHFGNEEEGVYGISVGTTPDAKEATVTLMIYDASTTFEPLAVRPLPGDGALDLAHHALAWHFPQLDTNELDLQTRAHAELAAKLFAAAPAAVFVYADLDMDKDLARPVGPAGDAAFPKKNEPLLVLEVGDHARVLAQDGLEYDVVASHLALAPDGAPALLAAPRALRGNLDIGALEQLTADKKATAEYDGFEKRYGDCVDRVAEPYERQIPRVVSSDGSSVELETAHTRSLRDAEDSAIIHACGSRDAHDAAREKFRTKLLTAAEKARVGLLATAKPRL